MAPFPHLSRRGLLLWLCLLPACAPPESRRFHVVVDASGDQLGPQRQPTYGVIPSFPSRPVYVIGDQVVADACPYDGCALKLTSTNGAGFRCPCCGSEFDRDGTLVKGPATRGLYQYATSVVDGVIRIPDTSFRSTVVPTPKATPTLS
ncbi:MAG: Rieske 2Fe-2S domain-containing protein [bacterium]|nr:Rieske 2Fe-2S domain-containing protein [bacterium]